MEEVSSGLCSDRSPCELDDPSEESMIKLEQNPRCLLCGRTAEDCRFSSDSNELLFVLWDENCAKSLCKLFNLDESYQKMFIKAEYCSNCHNKLRDIDFSLRTLDYLQQRLNDTRKSVEELLKKNYETIQDNSVKFRSNDSYNEMVKVFYQILLPSQYYEAEGKKESMYSRRLTRQSKKVIPIPVSEESDVESVGYENYDSDFNPGPQLEIILKDETVPVKADGDFDSEEDFSSSNSSDENWEVSNSTSKKKIRKPKRVTRSSGTKGSLVSSGGNNDIKRVVWVEPQSSSRSKRRKIKLDPRARALRCNEENCTFTCSAQFKMQAHINKIHKGDPMPFHCDKCELKFGSTTSFYYHRKKHEETNPVPSISCDLCDKMFLTTWQRKRHMGTTHPHGKKVRCSQCRKMFDKVEELEDHEELHKQRVESDPFACVICLAGFTNTHDLKSHVLLEHEPLLRANKCDSCNKVFETQKNLKRHIRTVHKERDPKLKCPRCPFIGLYTSSLTRHLIWHDAERNYVCDHCGQGYKSQSCLNYHLRAAHSDQKLYPCHVCKKKFNSGCALKAHEESHNKVKTYVCETCGKAFMGKKYLIQHMRSHKGIKVRYGKRGSKSGIRVGKPKADLPIHILPNNSPPIERSEVDEDHGSESGSSSVPNQILIPQFGEAHHGHQNQRIQLSEAHLRHTFTTNDPVHNPHYYLNPSASAEGLQYTTMDLSQSSSFLTTMLQQQQQRHHSLVNSYFPSVLPSHRNQN